MGHGLLFLLVCLISLETQQISQSKPKFYPVRVDAAAGKLNATGKQTIEIRLDINPGWCLIALSDNMELAGTQPQIWVNNPEKIKVLKITFPEGELEKNNAIGNFRLYKGRITIPVQIQKNVAKTIPVEFNVYVQPYGFEVGQCIMPKKFTVTVP